MSEGAEGVGQGTKVRKGSTGDITEYLKRKRTNIKEKEEESQSSYKSRIVMRSPKEQKRESGREMQQEIEKMKEEIRKDL